MDAGTERAIVHGATRDLERVVATHLFVICPNNSGSSFLKEALATCRATWSLPREAHRIPGFAGPVVWRPVTPGQPRPGKLWASRRDWIDLFTDGGAYDWSRTRRAWYFFAFSRDPNARVFVVKSPPHLLVVDDLAKHFRNARFLFMVRNPYAVCEGICRDYRGRWEGLDGSLEEAAAVHVVNCFARQRRNLEAHGVCPRVPSGERGVFFTYEAMCAEPERVAHEIRTLVPELDDLDLRRRLSVKGYDEMLADMNARQIARLGAGQVAAFNRVFGEHRDLFDHFGYEMLDAGAFRPEAGRPEGAPLPPLTR